MTFFGALKATEGTVMNGGRSFMIVSSSMWGSAWGVAAAFVFGAGAADGAEPPPPALYTGLTLTGGLLYGVTATALTWGDNPFPATRAWLFNLGSVLGSLLGLGVPYVLGADSPAVIYAGMLTGSVAGSATALYLTRDMTEGRSIGNLSHGAALRRDAFGGRRGAAVARAVRVAGPPGAVPAAVPLLVLR